MNRLMAASIAAVLAGAGSAMATTVFSDGFETAVATPDTWAQQDANPGTRTDNDPANTTGASFSAQQGQWFHYNKSGVPIHNIQVTNNPSPGAAEGNNYLRIHRVPGSDSANIGAAVTAWDQPLTTGIVTANYKAYFPSFNTAFQGGFYMAQFLDNDHGGGTTGSKAVMFIRDGGVIRLSFDSFGNNPDLSSPVVTEDKWQDWTLRSDLDAKTFTVTIDGVTSSPQAFNYPGSAVTGLVFNGQDGQEYYVDAVSIDYVVPEPGTVALAGIAAAGLMLRRRTA